MKRLCESAGITGYKTNHLLRVTAATRLFQSGVDEQVIKNVTGHRSVDGVRAYKRMSEEQYQDVSNILQVSSLVVPKSQNSWILYHLKSQKIFHLVHLMKICQLVLVLHKKHVNLHHLDFLLCR